MCLGVCMHLFLHVGHAAARYRVWLISGAQTALEGGLFHSLDVQGVMSFFPALLPHNNTSVFRGFKHEFLTGKR